MLINDKENQSIKFLEQELIDAQILEFNMRAIDKKNIVEKLVTRAAVTSGLYTNQSELIKLSNELKMVLKGYAKQANSTGKILAKKSLDRFLTESETRDITQRKLRLISQATESQAKRRLAVSYLEIDKEIGILKADIDIFKKRSAIAGFTTKDTIKNLIIAAKEKEGFSVGFSKRIKQINVAAVRRERSSAEIAEYEKKALPGEKWQWISISGKPCPDCEARAGRVFSLPEWRKLGTPGSGRTICNVYCKCKLIPFSVSEDLFPTVKVFDWDTNKQVLTTASEARRLKALSNQAPQKVSKK